MPDESSAAPRHVPVLVAEVLQALDPQPGQTLVDATLGGAGHARLLLERIGPTGRLIGIDQDESMLNLARASLAEQPVTLVHGSFDQLRQILDQQGVGQVDGLLADLGFCSDQMDDPERGLSFSRNGPLDMRLNRNEGEPASSLLRRLDERELADLIYEYGEERFSRRIARRIVEERQQTPLETTEQLAHLIRRCVPRSKGGHSIDPATRTFQALRIAVNQELAALDRLLEALPSCVKIGGRVAIISFHSLEDRRVKHALRDQPAIWDPVTRKPRQATEEESRSNPRSRSARLRAAIRVDGPVKRKGKYPGKSHESNP